MSKINNRRNVRVECGVQARAEGPRGPLPGICRNLSIGGLFFRGPTLPVGSSAELTLQMPQGPVAAMGEVRYHHTYADGTGMGIRFTRLSQAHLQVISNYVFAPS